MSYRAWIASGGNEAEEFSQKTTASDESAKRAVRDVWAAPMIGKSASIIEQPLLV